MIQAKPAAERMGLRRRGAALRQGAAAGCCAHSGAIQNSKFKIQNYYSGCSLRRDGTSRRELRASAAPRLRPARSWRTDFADKHRNPGGNPGGNPKLQPAAVPHGTANSGFKTTPPYRPPQPGPLRQKKGAPPARGSAPFSASSEAKPAAATAGACRARSSSRPPGCRTPADPYRPG